ncbi:LysR substrate-binding domain-containing protein [Hydrogenimonas thermophila]|uniref:DNA-binding transcriptional regulator, LysR family n=1 Tax=Hydrogenimonas thermophila TaxID=223786 RepID=A0A1I5NG24_9BACT|nr:LysR substrate-binding domain-containing protein [Hydrogenimonas thermophila]WOE69851.1 LysR substrate-binding domain-containing protein [Hydrogenimonas thermophila]WOE72366.1 LysR substrate-binding domain-containing protein [Hydrogenimonas thermophila]SFP20677.1 DNA-binding transcriptional regulator, LysR family [Hydrogenimonas thermophila]
MKITLRQMEIFLEVAQIGHLTKVAERMGLSQSAVSMSIKELESIIGYKLFDRINKKLVLNEKGRAFAEAISPLVSKLNDIEEEFKNDENNGELLIGVSTTIADYLIPPIICQYMNSFPQVKVNLKVGNTRKIVEMIENGQVDLGFVEGNVDSTSIKQEVVGLDELIIVTGDRNLAMAQDEYYIDSLLGKQWILREEGSGTREVFLTHLGDLASQLNLFLELGHPESIKNMLIQSGKCLTCLPRISVMKELERGDLYEIKTKNLKFERQFLLIYHKDKYKTSLLSKFIYFTRMQLGKILEH